MKLLNIGCGHHYHTDWINLDLYKSKFVKYYNIKHKLPFLENSVDAIYHSHVLEHLNKTDGKRFLMDCYRVLKYNGIIRIVVPDLEKICLEYLSNLREGFDKNDQSVILNYQWNKIELFDQIVREKSGGEMLEVIKNGKFNEDYVIARNGEEIKDILDKQDNKNDDLVFRLKLKIINLLRQETKLSKFFISFIKKANPQKSGEAHRWMYDRLDLKILLESVGFKGFKIVKYNESRILDWDRYALDKAKNEDCPRKPDSLFVEAIK